jgi:hypothetical protein
MQGETFEWMNLKHVRLRDRPLLEWMLYYQPTERRILWIIANCKEAFNPKHSLQYAKSKTSDPNDHQLRRSFEMLHELKGKGFIEQSNDGNWHVTWNGHLHRLTTHPQWDVIKWSIPIAITLTFGILNCRKNTHTSDKSPVTMQSTATNFDSGANVRQSVSGSLSQKSDSSKRKDSSKSR